MEQIRTSLAARTPRSNADYRWTPAKALAFLDALARCGKIAEAARAVGMSRQSAYRLRARSDDPRWVEEWELASRAAQARRRRREALQGDGFARKVTE